MFEAQPDDVTFHAAADLDEAAFRQVQANVRKRILRAFVARGHIEACDAKDMAAYAHGGGFSVDAGVRIEAPDRAGLERLLRYCARPPFAMDRLKQRGADLVYRCGKGHSEPLQSDKYPGELVLTPLELIERHRSVGAATAHTPPPLLRRAGTQLAIAGGRDGDGAGRTGVDARRAQSRDTECMQRCRYHRRSRRLWCIWCSGPA